MDTQLTMTTETDFTSPIKKCLSHCIVCRSLRNSIPCKKAARETRVKMKMRKALVKLGLTGQEHDMTSSAWAGQLQRNQIQICFGWGGNW